MRGAEARSPSQPIRIEALAPPPLAPTEARALAAMAHSRSGVVVAPEKIDFIRARLSRRLRDIDCGGFADYLARLDGPGGEAECRHLVEALTTHTTSFFREAAHFEWLATAGLPALVERGAGALAPLTVWSAACSTGAEMWSIGMEIARFARSRGAPLRFELIGTDISRRILRRAAGATFTESEIGGLPEDLRRLHLLRAQPKGPGGPAFYRIAPDLRARARLAFANLLDLGRGPQIAADVIFLRNVLIYFAPEDQRRAAEAVVARLRPGGYLLTGHTEALPGRTHPLRQLGASIYQRT